MRKVAVAVVLVIALLVAVVILLPSYPEPVSETSCRELDGGRLRLCQHTATGYCFLIYYSGGLIEVSPEVCAGKPSHPTAVGH